MRVDRAAYAARANSSLELSFAITKIRHLTIPNRMKANFFRRLSILFRPHQKLSRLFREGMKACGGAAGYRPRVQSAYYKRVYHHSWQASPVNIGR